MKRETLPALRSRKTRPDADGEALRDLHFLCVLSREWDLRFEALVRTGGVGKWYSAVGNEGVTVPAGLALEPRDCLVTLHRDVGAILAQNLDARALRQTLPGAEESMRYLRRLACQMLGRAEGFTGGFDRSFHFGNLDDETGRYHIGMISHLGAMVPVSAGVAMAQSLWRDAGRADGRVTINFIGDGGTSTGEFHEGLNMAAVWRVPLVLIIENNRWAFSTPLAEQCACEDLATRAAGYGIPGVVVDGGDPIAAGAVIADAVDRARRGEGPTLIEAKLGRLRGHAEGDGSFESVPAEERERHRAADPIPALERRLAGDGLMSTAEIEEMRRSIRELVAGVVEEARTSPAPHARSALAARSIFAAAEPIEETAGRTAALSGATTIDAINRALREEMLRDESVLLLGQDIAEFGGAFRATAGLMTEFGGARVRNTPIAEAGAIGIAAGAALMGLRPVVEMQFADFISNGFNQLVNVAAKLHFRWGESVPIVVRLPSGGGVSAGPFHSQNPEAWFAHAPGLKIVAPAYPWDALGLLKAAIRDPNPVLYFEHKYLYRRVREPLPEGEVLVPIGKARVVRAGSDLTAVSYGWMLHRTLEAADRLQAEGISIEVIDLRTLVPLDDETILASIERTSKLAIVHEATRTCGIGAEIAARVASAAFELLDGPVERITYPDVPVPYEQGLESACLPDVERISEGLRRLARY